MEPTDEEKYAQLRSYDVIFGTLSSSYKHTRLTAAMTILQPESKSVYILPTMWE